MKDVTEDETTGRFHKACKNVDAIRSEAEDETVPSDEKSDKGKVQVMQEYTKTKEQISEKESQEQKIRDWFKKPALRTNALTASDAFQTLSFEEAFNKFADEGEEVVIDKKLTRFAGLASVGGKTRDSAHRDSAHADGATDGEGGEHQGATAVSRKEDQDRKHLVMTLQVTRCLPLFLLHRVATYLCSS